MTDLRGMLSGAVDADSHAINGDVLADALCPGVRRRVRTRRGVQAAGVGSLAAVSVGAVMLGAARLPGPGEMQPATGGSTEECPPGTVVATAVEDPSIPGSAAVPEGIDDPPEPGASDLEPVVTSAGTEIINGEEVEVFEIEVTVSGTPSYMDSVPAIVCVTPVPTASPMPEPSAEPSPNASEREALVDELEAQREELEREAYEEQQSLSPSPAPSADEEQ